MFQHLRILLVLVFKKIEIIKLIIHIINFIMEYSDLISAKMLPILTKIIDDDKGDGNYNPRPQANSLQLHDGYQNLLKSSNDFIVISRGYPITKEKKVYIPYVIYMVKYNGNYWIVPYDCSKESTYSISQYSDEENFF